MLRYTIYLLLASFCVFFLTLFSSPFIFPYHQAAGAILVSISASLFLFNKRQIGASFSVLGLLMFFPDLYKIWAVTIETITRPSELFPSGTMGLKHILFMAGITVVFLFGLIFSIIAWIHNHSGNRIKMNRISQNRFFIWSLGLASPVAIIAVCVWVYSKWNSYATAI